MKLLKYPSLILVVAAMAVASLAPVESKLSGPKVAPPWGWRELSSPHYIWPCGGAIYYSFPLSNGSRAHLVVVN